MNDGPNSLILLVDDEPNNLRLLQGDLEDAGYSHLLLAENGQQAMALLEQHHEEIRLILLDRMMPVMDGMEVISHMKADARLRHIPVIMQTAAASKQQMLEGISAGVYYYLTKPYDDDMLLAITAAALRDYQASQLLREQTQLFQHNSHLLIESHFQLKTLTEASYLSSLLAGFLPDPERSVTGISELLINAIEHGNLGISYQMKGRLLLQGEWEAEITRRLSLPEFESRRVRVQYQRLPQAVEITITDEGDGFDWQNYLEISPERLTHAHGRGIALAAKYAFDALEYMGTGNTVRGRIHLTEKAQ